MKHDLLSSASAAVIAHCTPEPEAASYVNNNGFDDFNIADWGFMDPPSYYNFQQWMGDYEILDFGRRGVSRI